MKLFEVPRGSLIRVIKPEPVPPGAPPLKEGQICKFHHIDGMYSFCTDPKDPYTTYHLRAWQEVEVVEEKEAKD